MADIDANLFILQLQKGDSMAFETLFKLYYDKLLHLAKSYLIYKEDAEGIVQNLFLKVWEKREHLEHVTNLNNYLYTMCKNGCLDHLKHEKVKRSYVSNQQTTINIHTQFIKDQTASLLLENELENQILKSIELLPPKCKAVFVKSRYEDLKYQEIATELGISKKTVEGHISKALSHMRIQLKEFLTLFL
ncbi:RNA polymerase sigma-70 factor [Polaribacter cellanae]|uniref:RNA polymerase sigma-70 factor n=1 Tax=Polaribacter cellanae TaxID=2818493 RepID=A0A975CNA2_9FLAO|nr:RNA polymerase sigma-70 factor [Polaribacter cellanae]QTE22360.1 RNA polymerase sigma-70 factor [Polaribacter cellanae]